MADKNPILESINQNPKTPSTAKTELEIVSPILREAESYAARTEQRTKQQEELISQQTSVTDEITKAAEKSVRSAEVISRQQAVADLEAQNANIDVFKAAGGTDFLVTLAKEQKDAAQRVIDLTNKIDSARGKSTGVFDAIITELALIPQQIQLEGAIDEFNSLNTSARNINAMTESSARAHALTRKSINQAVIKAQQEQISAESQVKLGEMKLETLKTNADQLDAMMAADAKLLSARLQAYQIRNSEEDRKIRREQLALATAAAERQRKDWEQGKDIEAATVQAIQAAQAIANQPVETEEAIMFGLQARSPAIRDKYETLFVIGASQNEQIGSTPADSLINMMKISSTGVPDTPEFSILEELNTEIRLQPTPPKNQDEYTAAVNSLADTKAEQFLNKIVTGDQSNWYHAPPMSVLTANSEAVRNSELYKEVLEPMEMEEIDPERIITSAAAGVRAGKISVETAAADIATIFTAAGDYNNVTKKFKRIGLPEQTEYNTVISDKTGGLLATGISMFIAPFEILAPGEKERKEYREALKRFRTGRERINLQDETAVREMLIRSFTHGTLGEALKDIKEQGEK